MKVAKIYKHGGAIPFDTTINAIPDLEEKINTIVKLIQERDPEFSVNYETRDTILSINQDVFGYVTVDSVLGLASVIESIQEELKKDIFND